MKFEEIRTATIMALYKANKDLNKGIFIPANVQEQADVIGKFFSSKFLLSCLRESQIIEKDQNKFDLLFKKYETVGNNFCTIVEEIEDEERIKLFEELENLEEEN